MYIADVELEKLNVVGGTRRSCYNPCRTSNPVETISLSQKSVAVSSSASSLCLTVSRTGKGAGQGKPVGITLG